MYMDVDLRRVALRIKMHNVSGNVVHHNALLKRFLEQKGVKCELVKGFCVIHETKEACEHYWVRVPLENSSSFLDLDLSFEVAKLKSPELQALYPALLESIEGIPNLVRSDENEFVIRHENERLFELFQRDPKAFWHEAPQDVRAFQMTH
jgi:hypothetical protein